MLSLADNSSVLLAPRLLELSSGTAPCLGSDLALLLSPMFSKHWPSHSVSSEFSTLNSITISMNFFKCASWITDWFSLAHFEIFLLVGHNSMVLWQPYTSRPRQVSLQPGSLVIFLQKLKVISCSGF